MPSAYISISLLEAVAVKEAIERTLNSYILGRMTYPDRRKRDALRRVRDKLPVIIVEDE